MNKIESSSQSAGVRERLAEAMIVDANESDCAYVLVVGWLMVEVRREMFDPSVNKDDRGKRCRRRSEDGKDRPLQDFFHPEAHLIPRLILVFFPE